MQTFTDLFYYDEIEGRLRNKGSLGRKKDKLSSRFDSSSGYYRVNVFGKSFLEHRIIYEMLKGPFIGDLDHIDRDKLNNRIENLRLCNRPQNVVNSKVRIDNKYGYKGVTWHKSSSKYAAQTMIMGKRLHLGLFNSPEEAAAAYNKAIYDLHGDFAVLNEILETR